MFTTNPSGPKLKDFKVRTVGKKRIKLSRCHLYFLSWLQYRSGSWLLGVWSFWIGALHNIPLHPSLQIWGSYHQLVAIAAAALWSL